MQPAITKKYEDVMTNDVIKQLKIHKTFIESGFKPLDKEVISNPKEYYSRLPTANIYHLNYHHPDTNHIKVLVVGIKDSKVTTEKAVHFGDVLSSAYGDTQKDQLVVVLKNLYPKLDIDKMLEFENVPIDIPRAPLYSPLMNKIQSQRGDTTEPKKNNVTP